MKKIATLLLAALLAGCAGRPSPTPAPDLSPETASPPAEAMTDEPASATPVTTEATEPAGSESNESSAAADPDHAELLNRVLFGQGGPETLAQIREADDTRFVAGLIDSLRYRRDLGEEIGATLNSLTGQNLEADWFAWVEWAGQQPDIESFAGYPGWKANLFAQIDPTFLRFVHRDMSVAANSRVEEIVWGGVRVDGIPALDNPKMIDPAEAAYLVPQERVFGVSLNGDSRAYPARFLDWHEMFNDVVGGEPVSLAY